MKEKNGAAAGQCTWIFYEFLGEIFVQRPRDQGVDDSPSERQQKAVANSRVVVNVKPTGPSVCRCIFTSISSEVCYTN
jgi:hypothetical protein